MAPTIVPVSSRIEFISATALIEATRRLRETTAVMAREASGVANYLAEGNRPHMVGSQTVSDVLEAQAAWTATVDIARHALTADVVNMLCVERRVVAQFKN